jgi:hypothetical protein
MANAVSMMETVGRAVRRRAGIFAGSCQPATVAVYVAGPAGTVHARLGTPPPAASVSTVSHDPSVNLNSTGPGGARGMVSTYSPPGPAVSRKAGSAGFHPLKLPAT